MLFATCLTRFCHQGPVLQHNSHLTVDCSLELSFVIAQSLFKSGVK